jgi:hypothetical protein
MEGATTPAPAASAPSGAAGTETNAAAGEGAAPESTQANQAAQTNDDPEYDLGGEKLKRSEYKRLRDLEAKRKEYDRAASLKFEEAAKLRKEVEAKEAQSKAILGTLSKDTKRALREAGLTDAQIVEFAERTLAEALEENGLTPEQKRLRELEAREAERAREAEEAKKLQESEQETAAVSQLTDNIADSFLGVLKPKNLPADDLPEIVGRMAYRVEALIDAGVPIDLEAVADETLERFYGAPKQRFAGLTDEQLLERYPEEAERFRKALLAKANKQPPSRPQAIRPSKPAASKRGLTMAELQERIDKRIGA